MHGLKEDKYEEILFKDNAFHQDILNKNHLIAVDDHGKPVLNIRGSEEVRLII